MLIVLNKYLCIISYKYILSIKRDIIEPHMYLDIGTILTIKYHDIEINLVFIYLIITTF